MSKFRLRNLLGIIIAVLCSIAILPHAHAAKPVKPAKPQQAQKERLVLMPLRIPEEDKSLQGAMETALVEGLQQKYVVFSGEQVAQKAREIFLKESRNTAKKECDETRCMQGIAEAFQAELLATANVTKQGGNYFLALSVQNIFDNKVEYSKTLTCKNCEAVDVVEKLKELSGASVPVAAAPAAPAPQTAAEPEAPKVTAADPDSTTWNEAQKGNTVDDYQVYLDAYPKGKYITFAKAKIKKLKEAQQAAAEQQEQQAWDAAQAENSEASYGLYLKGYPNGRFAGFAKTRQSKLKNDLAAKEEADLWKKADTSNDQAAVETYLNKYPSGRYITAASAKLKLIKEEAAKGPAMVKIPGRNYEMGKYHVTRGEFAKFMSETNYDAGNSCRVWNGSKWEERSGSNWRNPGFTQDDTHPVVCVNWNDANAYVQWLSRKTGRIYKLPTESEWEAACYAGNQTEYCGGSDINSVAWYKDNSGSQTHPVGQKQANGYGLYDMSGNAWQWMENWYDSNKTEYGSALRGGSWDYSPQYVRAANRNFNTPDNRRNSHGFRLARTLP